MPYPTEQRFKILQQQYQDAQQIAAPAPAQRPQAIPGLVIDFITRSDAGYALKVIPLTPINITSAGELTFVDDSNPVPTNANQLFYIIVFPIDAEPANVQSSYQVGQTIMCYPYWGPKNSNVRGSFICIEGGASIPVGEFQGMALMNVSQSQVGYSYPFFHELV